MFSVLNISYDFTDAINKAFGNNMVDLNDGNFAFWSGDIIDAATLTLGIQDGIVELNDLAFMKSGISQILVGYFLQDLTGDWVVESADYIIMENNNTYLIISIGP